VFWEPAPEQGALEALAGTKHPASPLPHLLTVPDPDQRVPASGDARAVAEEGLLTLACRPQSLPELVIRCTGYAWLRSGELGTQCPGSLRSSYPRLTLRLTHAG
jgi:hypothetical protein